MVSCYHDRVVFEDPAFGELQADDACAMWQMLCSSDTDLSVRHTILDVGESTGNGQLDCRLHLHQLWPSGHQQCHGESALRRRQGH